MGDLECLLAGVALCPEDDTGWLALADCLAEQGEDDQAELTRLQLDLRRRLDHPEWPAWQRRQGELWRGGTLPCLPTLQGPYGIDFVLIPLGSFWMGAPPGEEWMDADELPRRRVKLPHAVYF